MTSGETHAKVAVMRWTEHVRWLERHAGAESGTIVIIVNNIIIMMIVVVVAMLKICFPHPTRTICKLISLASLSIRPSIYQATSKWPRREQSGYCSFGNGQMKDWRDSVGNRRIPTEKKSLYNSAMHNSFFFLLSLSFSLTHSLTGTHSTSILIGPLERAKSWYCRTRHNRPAGRLVGQAQVHERSTPLSQSN